MVLPGPLLLAAALALALAPRSAHSIDMSQCIAPLGMESGQIADADISASSCYNDGNVAPHNGRLNVERAGGAWCPRSQISPEAAEWLEVDLRAVHVLTAVGTQGRFGNGQGQEYAEAYALEYWRPRLARWVRYRADDGREILAGNTNTYLEVKNQLSPAVWASKVRFVPHTTHRRTVCMRVELYGCLWNEGVVSYSMRAGDTRSNGVELSDATYDGWWAGGEVRGGLGQLVDGEYGGDEIREAARRSPWVGWRNESARAPPHLTFEFDRVREFTAVHVHCSNRFMRDVRLFSSAVVRFSVGGAHYQREAVRHLQPPDDIFESARNVTVRLHRRIARFVRLELAFGARWLLVSEVVWESEPALGEHAAERGPPPAPPAPPAPPRAAAPARRDDPLYVAVVVGVLAALAVLLAGAVLLLVHRHRHRKCFASPLAAAATPSSAHSRHPLPDYAACDASSMSVCEKSALSVGVGGCEESEGAGAGGGARGDDYQEPYEPPYRSYSTVLLEMDRLHAHTHATLALQDSSYEYAVPEPSAAPLLSTRGAHHHDERCSSRTSEGSGRVVTREVPELPPHRLRMISKLAEGAFGAVFVAEAEGAPTYEGRVCERSLVAVKFLAAEASAGEVRAFERDVRVLAALAHPGLARVVAACARPPALVLEYLEGGDLCAHLRAAAPPPAARHLLHLADQLAAAMAYLEALGFVHRDLAARNCLVGADYRLKVGDFGTDNEAYARDYVRVEGRTVALRWAAPEAALEGLHSTAGDVWSFAVTVHEVFSLCRRRPLPALSDERVLAALRALAAGGAWEAPARAPHCPRALHRLLLQCWRRDPRARPSFRAASAALQRLRAPDH